MEKSRRNFDVAYGCFILIGVVMSLTSILSIVFYKYPTSAAGFAFLIGMPAFLSSAVAWIIGVGYTIALRWHWPLIGTGLSFFCL